jgi:hypothetical protein
LLRWDTDPHDEQQLFVIERSIDGQGFAEVAQLQASGNPARVYEYLDNAPEVRTAKTCYYRLRQINLDGTIVSSPIVVLRRS